MDLLLLKITFLCIYMYVLALFTPNTVFKLLLKRINKYKIQPELLVEREEVDLWLLACGSVGEGGGGPE